MSTLIKKCLQYPKPNDFQITYKGGIKPQKQFIFIYFCLNHCVHQPPNLERFFKVKTAGKHLGWQQTHILCTQACRYHTASCQSWEADVLIMSSPVNHLWTIIFHPETQQQIHNSVQFTMKHKDLEWDLRRARRGCCLANTRRDALFTPTFNYLKINNYVGYPCPITTLHVGACVSYSTVKTELS